MTEPVLRQASASDLEAINDVVTRAVMGWDLPERVKRLSLSSYLYSTHELDLLTLWVAEAAGKGIVAVAAWEEADSRDTPEEQNGLLLHGLYVDPDSRGQGIGGRLLRAALAAARDGGYAGLLVKAQPEADGFFRKQGMEPLPVSDPKRDYAHRFWQKI
jgi:GNAT superfamily N-acetyltransferase